MTCFLDCLLLPSWPPAAKPSLLPPCPSTQNCSIPDVPDGDTELVQVSILEAIKKMMT